MEEQKTQNELNTTNGKDPFLQMLTHLVNNSSIPFSFGITLLTHGFLVSGDLANGKEYMTGVAEDFGSVFDKKEDSAEPSIKDLFNKLGDQMFGGPNDNSEARPQPQHIHLRNARFYHPNGAPIPMNRGVWWRGRISEISGFSLGMLSFDQ